jgi:rhodanese-related sulfurtransferase
MVRTISLRTNMMRRVFSHECSKISFIYHRIQRAVAGISGRAPSFLVFFHPTTMATDDILEIARQRAEETGLPYSGALTPQEAHEIWCNTPGAKLVDVRTRAEWDYVGRIPGAVEIELLTYPGNRPNSAFVAELERQVNKEAPVMFICRSGGRSHNAALLAMQAGYADCYNVLEGFEGDRDASGHRNTKGGWRFGGLPWTQS